MKKAVSLFLVLFLTLVSLSATAQTKIKSDNDVKDGYISLHETKTLDIDPNQAQISISIEIFDKNLKVAVEKNKELANKVYSELKTILCAKDYIKTGEFSVTPDYIYTKERKKVLDKYIVRNTVVVKTKNLKLVPKIIDNALAKGATRIEGLSFTSTDYTNDCNDALVELTKSTFEKANKIANSINYKVSDIKTINTTCNAQNNNRYYDYRGRTLTEAGSKVGSTPVESGKIKLYANVDASFYVIKK